MQIYFYMKPDIKLCNYCETDLNGLTVVSLNIETLSTWCISPPQRSVNSSAHYCVVLTGSLNPLLACTKSPLVCTTEL